MKLLIAALVAAMLSFACATVPPPAQPRKLSGRCIHPFANKGQPFMISPDSKFDGSSLTLYFEDGASVTLFGAACVLREETP